VGNIGVLTPFLPNILSPSSSSTAPETEFGHARSVPAQIPAVGSGSDAGDVIRRFWHRLTLASNSVQKQHLQ
jgi:hypothetical protein